MLIAASLTAGMAAADDTDHNVHSFLDRTDPNQRLTVSHVHGAGFIGEDLILATHLGLIRFHDDDWAPVDSPPHDFMGFSLVSGGTYISGHPSLLHREGLDNPLGVMFTNDLGKTLKSKGYNGEVDFHWLTAGYSTTSVYALTSSAPLTGAPLFIASSNRGATWGNKYLEGTSGSLIDIAAHPTAGNMVYILTSEGVFRSEDYGSRFRKLAPMTHMSTMAISRDGESIYAAGHRFLVMDINGRFKYSLTLPELDSRDAVRQIAVGPIGSGYLAYVTGFRHVYISKDDGENWKRILVGGDASH